MDDAIEKAKHHINNAWNSITLSLGSANPTVGHLRLALAALNSYKHREERRAENGTGAHDIQSLKCDYCRNPVAYPLGAKCYCHEMRPTQNTYAGGDMSEGSAAKPLPPAHPSKPTE